MASDRLYEFNGKKGHWYTDDQGNRYFVAQGQTPKEGWEATKRRKMIKGGKYVKDDGDDKGEQEISANEYQTYEADEEERFDETTDADFEDDEPEDFDKGDWKDDEGIPHLNDVRKFLQKHPEYEDVNIHEFQYDDGEKVLTGDIRKDGKLVARLEFDKDGNPVNNHGQVYSEIDFSEDDEDGTNGWKPSEEATPAYDVGGFYSINEGDRWEYEDGGYVKVEKVNGDKVTVSTPGGNRETITKDELSDMVKNAMKVPGKAKKGEPKPKKTVGEDLEETYEREFFKQANGNKEDFVNHFINRFGVPRGSSRKREAEFYGKRFDELSANQGQSEAQGPQTANIDANVDEIAKEVASKFGEANVKVGENGHILLKDPNGFDPVAIADEDEIPAGAIVKIMPNWREPNENPDDTYFVKEDRGDRLLLWSPSKSSSFGGYTYEWPKNTMYVPPRMRQGNPSNPNRGSQGPVGKQGSEGDSWSAENPKYKDFNTSDATNVKVLEEGEEYEDPNTGKKSKLKIIEYTPYGLLKFGRKDRMYGIVGDDYEGGDTHRKGAIVAPSLKSAKEQLKEFTDYYKSQAKGKKQ